MQWRYEDVLALPAPVFADLVEWLRDERRGLTGDDVVDMDRWRPPNGTG